MENGIVSSWIKEWIQWIVWTFSLVLLEDFTTLSRQVRLLLLKINSGSQIQKKRYLGPINGNSTLGLANSSSSTKIVYMNDYSLQFLIAGRDASLFLLTLCFRIILYIVFDRVYNAAWKLRGHVSLNSHCSLPAYKSTWQVTTFVEKVL